MIHTVVPGDCLYHIAQEYLGNGNDWPIIWEDNRAVVANPNLIYPHEKLYIPKHAQATETVSVVANSNSNIDARAYVPKHGNNNSETSAVAGDYSCGQLESLWIDNGGNPSSAFIAAEIAEAESGGNATAISPTNDRGLWQINYPSHGPILATFNPDGNARAAIEISDNGTDWQPWTTFQTGAYIGRC